MEYIVNVENENFIIVMFNYDERNWEICLDPLSTEVDIQYFIQVRLDSLTDEFLLNGDYDKSDLYVDYIKNEENN
jgi:hypothetical protein